MASTGRRDSGTGVAGRSPTVSNVFLTLPIACQICLGKVSTLELPIMPLCYQITATRMKQDWPSRYVNVSVTVSSLRPAFRPSLYYLVRQGSTALTFARANVNSAFRLS